MKRFALAIALAAFWSTSALALEGSAPNCVDNSKQPLAINNQQVIQWKETSKNEFHARGHVNGTVTKIYPVETGHQHFQLTMEGTSQTVEIVYEMTFGKINLQVGNSVEACGDYITSNAPYQSYPVSPDGALIHWVHKADNNHPPGFVIVNNVVYGQN
jgi:hypothetical protein